MDSLTDLRNINYSNPLISIIIATYNVENDLKNCLNSIINQNKNCRVEIIIIDGASTDNTCDIIQQYKDFISYWISEPDKGIYDAWNKGIEQSKAKWIMFLGADDLLVDGALDCYYNTINQNDFKDEIEYVSAKIHIVDYQNNILKVKGAPFQWPLYLKYMTVAHPGSLHSKTLFDKYGKFNTDIKIVGDYELLLRAGKTLKSYFINQVTVKMRIGGVSDSFAAIFEHYKVVKSLDSYSKLLAQFNLTVALLKYIVRFSLTKISKIIKLYLK